MKDSRTGALYAIAAYVMWGIVPIYWKWLKDIPALELLAHRVVWSALFVALIVVAVRKVAATRAALTRRTLAYLGASTVLIAGNWGLFIWAVQTNRILQASLGYYVNPLVNVLLGVVVLGERLRRPQVIAVTLAALGVVIMAVQKGSLPWISIVLAGTFAAYGLLRKTAPVDALVGLLIETMLLVPVAVAFVWLRGTVVARSTPGHLLLLVCAGPITALPLLFFTGAARRLPLSTLGFFQYISPTLQFLLAVLVYGEHLTVADVVAFTAIWLALFVFTWGTNRSSHGVR
jgi:chloramphenicol-sensitive protein RarD